MKERKGRRKGRGKEMKGKRREGKERVVSDPDGLKGRVKD